MRFSINPKNLWARSDKKNRLVLPESVAKNYALKPGARLYLEEETDYLRVYRPVDQLEKIYIEPTSQCNLNCIMCIRHSWQEAQGMMSKSTFDNIVRSFQSLPAPPTVCFSGFGEPLLHPQLAEMIARIKLYSRKIEIITNATLLNATVADQLIQAGLDMLWISLDGISADPFANIRSGASLDAIFENIGSFTRAAKSSLNRGVGIGVVFVAMKRNISDLPALIRLSSNFGISRIMVSNILPYTPEMCGEMLYNRALNDVSYAPSPWAPQINLPRIDMNGVTFQPLYQTMRTGSAVTSYGDLPGRGTNLCPFVHRGSTVIAWDGSLSPCLSLVHSHTSYLNKRERFTKRFIIGNINSSRLIDLWNSIEYSDFRKNVQEFDFSPCTVCGGCDMSSANEEDCFGNHHPTCGGCLWAQGVIQCP